MIENEIIIFLLNIIVGFLSAFFIILLIREVMEFLYRAIPYYLKKTYYILTNQLSKSKKLKLNYSLFDFNGLLINKVLFKK